jgi:hypothetical protein
MRRRTFVQSALATAAGLSLAPRPSFAATGGWTPAGMRDVDAVTGDGRPVTIGTKALTELKARLRGPLLLSGDDGYDDARRTCSG